MNLEIAEIRKICKGKLGRTS